MTLTKIKSGFSALLFQLAMGCSWLQVPGDRWLEGAALCFGLTSKLNLFE